MKRKQSLLRYLVPVLALVTGAALFQLDFADLRSMSEQVSSDVYHLAARQISSKSPKNGDPANRIVYVEIQAESEHQAGAWPIDRQSLASMVEALFASGANVVVLDNVFDEADPLSPSNRLDAAWEENADLSQIEAMANQPDHDALLATAMRKGKAVTAFHAIGVRSEFENAQPLKKAQVVGIEPQAAKKLNSYSRARTNLIQLSSASRGNGADNIIVDGDGKVRRIPLLVSIAGDVYPSQILEALRLAAGAESIGLDHRRAGLFDSTLELRSVQVGAASIPVDADGSLRLRFDKVQGVPKISVGESAPFQFGEEVSGKIVFLGMTKTRSNPEASFNVDHYAPLTHLKALATSQIQTGAFSAPTFWRTDIEFALLIVLGLLGIAIGMLLSPVTAVPVVVLVALAVLAAASYSFAAAHTYVNMVFPVGLLALTGLVSILSRGRSDAIEFRADGRSIDFIPEAATSELAKGKSAVKAPTVTKRKKSERRGTSLVCNIRGLAELESAFDQDPAGLTDMVGDFLAEVTDVIKGLNGTVIQYKNDQVVAAWNVHVEDPDHAISACECAFQLLGAVDRVNGRLEDHAHANQTNMDHLSLNIGINTGEVGTGISTAFKKNDFNSAGEAFHTAFWLNANAETYGPAIIVGEETYMAAHIRYAMLEIDLIALNERPEPYRVFALVGNPVTKASPSFRALESAHHQFFESYRNKKWTNAWSIIEQIRGMNGAMPQLYDLYEQRIENHMAHPPGVDWQGEYIEH